MEKNFLSSVYVIDAACFDECFLFHVNTRRHYFLQKLVVTLSFFQSPYWWFLEISVLKEVLILRYLHKSWAVVAPISKIKVSVLYLINFCNWFCDYVLYTLILWQFHTFLYKWIFFEKIKTSLEACFLHKRIFINSLVFIRPVSVKRKQN